jgi:hypothetical protein
VSISRQKIRKNIDTNETKRKEKIPCFQWLSTQLIDIKQLRKTKGQESLLPSHPGNTAFLVRKQQNFDPTDLLIFMQM